MEGSRCHGMLAPLTMANAWYVKLHGEGAYDSEIQRMEAYAVTLVGRKSALI
jgi:hypothetical protein